MPTYTNKYITLKRTSFEKYIKNGVLGNIQDNDSIDDVTKESDILLHLKLAYNFTFKEINNYVLYNFFNNDGLLKEISLPNLEKVNTSSMQYCFSYCRSLISANMNNLINIGNQGLAYCFQQCTSLTTAPTFANLTNIGREGLAYCFQNCSALTTAPTFANLTTVGNNGLQSCFAFCTSLTTAPTFANLISIGDYSASGNTYDMSYCFNQCTSLTTAPTFANLTSIGNYSLNGCFYYCSVLTTAPTFANVTTIGNNGLSSCFYGCTSLTTAPTFANLTSIGNGGLSQCFRNTKITSLSFPALTSTSFGSYTTQFNNMLSGVTGCTVHFPSNLQSVIGSWTDVTNGFGGTNTTVLFDLPATT